MKLRKKAKKYQGFTKERELYKLMFTPLPKANENEHPVLRPNETSKTVQPADK